MADLPISEMPADTFAPGILIPGVDESQAPGSKNVSITAEQLAPVREVAGRTGNVVLTTGDLADFDSAAEALITSADAGINTSLGTLHTQEAALATEVAALESSAGGVTVSCAGTTYTGVGSITITGSATITGSNGTTAGLGAVDIVLDAGGGGGPQPIIGTTTTLSPPSSASFSLSAFGTAAVANTLVQEAGGPLQIQQPLEGNGASLAYDGEAAPAFFSLVTLQEMTPLMNAVNPSVFGAAIVLVGTAYIIAFGIGSSSGELFLEARQYSLAGAYMSTLDSVPVTTRTGWFQALYTSAGGGVRLSFSPNNVSENWQQISEPFSVSFGTSISVVGAGSDPFTYYSGYNGSTGSSGVFENTIYHWELTNLS